MKTYKLTKLKTIEGKPHMVQDVSGTAESGTPPPMIESDIASALRFFIYALDPIAAQQRKVFSMKDSIEAGRLINVINEAAQSKSGELKLEDGEYDWLVKEEGGITSKIDEYGTQIFGILHANMIKQYLTQGFEKPHQPAETKKAK